MLENIFEQRDSLFHWFYVTKIIRRKHCLIYNTRGIFSFGQGPEFWCLNWRKGNRTKNTLMVNIILCLFYFFKLWKGKSVPNLFYHYSKPHFLSRFSLTAHLCIILIFRYENFETYIIEYYWHYIHCLPCSHVIICFLVWLTRHLHLLHAIITKLEPHNMKVVLYLPAKNCKICK